MLKTVDVSVRHLWSVAVLTLSGDVTGQATHDLTEAYDIAVAMGPDALLLDFAEVEYINSTGIAVLVSLLARARRKGRRMAACGLTPHYREVFAVTRLADYIEVFDDEQQALHGLGGSSAGADAERQPDPNASGDAQAGGAP
ncbi:MAG TPA: STAS domain-containing protein [Euzebyales bacterium]